jgi:hypothetical protein
VHHEQLKDGVLLHSQLDMLALPANDAGRRVEFDLASP